MSSVGRWSAMQGRCLALRGGARGSVVLIALGAMAAGVQAQGAVAPSPLIYSCVDAAGHRRTSDRPIAECHGLEQRILNADGSLRRVLPPTMTAQERIEYEARERDAAVARANNLDAVRRDRHLLSRFPDEAAHEKAREAALEDPRRSLRLSQARLDALAEERKPLRAEMEFYVGKPLPPSLRAKFDANDALVGAQRSLVVNQQLEVQRIDNRFDAELERLKRLWAGAPLGSMGVAANSAASAPGR